MRHTSTLLVAVYLLLSFLSRITALQQPLESCPPICRCHRCLPEWIMCGPCDHPCCCDTPKVCCQGRNGCQIQALSEERVPVFAYLKHYGPGPGAPCCGANCTTTQCLNLILIELVTLQTPLEVQQSQYKPVPDEDRCCGQGCTDAQCFQDVSFTFVNLQTPIRLTLNSTDERPGIGEGMLDGISKTEL